MVLVLEKGATKKQMEQLNKKLSHLPVRKKLDAKKYCGVSFVEYHDLVNIRVP